MDRMEKEETRLRQCLQDCDMTKDKIEEYVCCKDADQLRLLHQQRKKLMDKLHKAQHKVDVVDYMIHQVKEKEG